MSTPGFPTSQYGGNVLQGGRWVSGVRIADRINTVPIEWVVDPTLASLGQDPFYPNRDFVVIPRGRFVGVRPENITNTRGNAIITIAQGVDPLDPPSFVTSGNVPIGYCAEHAYRNFAGLPAQPPLVSRMEVIQLPYTAINDLYCTQSGPVKLTAGEMVMPFYGSSTSSTATHDDKGKFVRWIPKTVYQEDCAATGTVLLTKAKYPAFKPRILMAFTTGSVIVTTGATLAYTSAGWTAAFAGYTTIDSVIYEYGAEFSQAIGQIASIEPVSSTHHLAGWLRWVVDNFSAWDLPPIVNVRPRTTVTAEAVTIASDNTGTLTYYPVVPMATITVVITGTIVAADGTSTASTGLTLSLADTYAFADYTQGQYYDIDFLTGAIRFSSNVSVTACTVSYSYDTSWRDGRNFSAGIQGLTDGRSSGLFGLPPEFDVAGVLGVARIEVL